jgi:hypothetical protein
MRSTVRNLNNQGVQCSKEQKINEALGCFKEALSTPATTVQKPSKKAPQNVFPDPPNIGDEDFELELIGVIPCDDNKPSSALENTAIPDEIFENNMDTIMWMYDSGYSSADLVSMLDIPSVRIGVGKKQIKEPCSVEAIACDLMQLFEDEDELFDDSLLESLWSQTVNSTPSSSPQKVEQPSKRQHQLVWAQKLTSTARLNSSSQKVEQPSKRQRKTMKRAPAPTPVKIDFRTMGVEESLEEVDIPSSVALLEEYDDIPSIVPPLEEYDSGEDEFGFVSDSIWGAL